MKSIVITGAAGAIGSAVADMFSQKEWRVYLLDNNPNQLEVTRAKLQEKRTNIVAIPCDVSNPAQVADAFTSILNAGDQLEGLVNSAGIVNHHAHILDLQVEDWDRILNANLKGVFLCSQAAATIMAKQKSGAIVNVGSISSRRAHREQTAYDAAKGGIEALTRAAALDLAPYSIRVNAVLPAAIATDTMIQHTAENFARKECLIPLGRYGKPEEVAEVCEFLICKATYITGQCIIVDGGLDGQLRPLEMEYVTSPHFREETMTS